MSRVAPRHELSAAALALHGPLPSLIGHATAETLANRVADALHAAGHDTRVAADPDFPRWVEVTDPETGDVHARIQRTP